MQEKIKGIMYTKHGVKVGGLPAHLTWNSIYAVFKGD